MIMSAREGIDRMLKFAEQNGWTWSKTKKGHYKFVKEGCTPVFSSSTPSCPRACMNAIGQLRRATAAGCPQQS